ncbi:swr1 complex component [Dimargaris verticillata]|uniref:Swr1 complex component n=1 Tax=Dimargaris verticillata TaxID=2761393 RepID=A0A9W8B4R8_9FUNG|nr:swr1 complex component [Dimargaris verticillata]
MPKTTLKAKSLAPIADSSPAASISRHGKRRQAKEPADTARPLANGRSEPRQTRSQTVRQAFNDGTSPVRKSPRLARQLNSVPSTPTPKPKPKPKSIRTTRSPITSNTKGKRPVGRPRKCPLESVVRVSVPALPSTCPSAVLTLQNPIPCASNLPASAPGPSSAADAPNLVSRHSSPAASTSDSSDREPSDVPDQAESSDTDHHDTPFLPTPAYRPSKHSKYWLIRPGTQLRKPRRRLGGLQVFLESFVTLSDQSGYASPVEAAQQVRHDAKVQSQLARQTSSVAPSATHTATPPNNQPYSFRSFKAPIDPQKPQRNHWDVVLSHIHQHSKQRLLRTKELTACRRKMVKAIDKYWDLRRTTREKQTKYDQGRLRRLARWTGREVLKKWKAIETAVRQKLAAEELQRQQQQGQLQLQRMLEHSSKVLESQQRQWQLPIDKDSSSVATLDHGNNGDNTEAVTSDDMVIDYDTDESRDSELQALQAEQNVSLETLLETYRGYLTQQDANISSVQTDASHLTASLASNGESDSDSNTEDDADDSLLTLLQPSTDEQHSMELAEPSPPTVATCNVSPSAVLSHDTTDDQAMPTDETVACKESPVAIPFLLRGTLRSYQVEGLRWLVNLYYHNLNGILADEMGLGKTIQTIALLAYLACSAHVWGPHLIIVPTSVLMNWEREFHQWCPGFKVISYFGTPKERKALRQGWSKPNAFHVCITSYQLALQDQNVFRRKQWQYMILDEAHHIKNFRSKRWQTLLGFHARHRLLLTGTPLQNNLGELWSLLYFLMPTEMGPVPAGEIAPTAPNIPNRPTSHQGSKPTSLPAAGFASLYDFRQWFAQPIEQVLVSLADPNGSNGVMAGGASGLSAPLSGLARQAVQQLHTLLRPYLLRRLKAQVEHQLPQKYEHVVYCPLAKRQRYLYDDFMSRATTRQALTQGSYLSVIHCLMQLRKVCNHPDLFETRPIRSPWAIPRHRSPLVQYAPTDRIVRRCSALSVDGYWQTQDDNAINDTRSFIMSWLGQLTLVSDYDPTWAAAVQPLWDRASHVPVDVQQRTVTAATHRYTQLIAHGRAMQQRAAWHQHQRWAHMAYIQGRRWQQAHGVYRSSTLSLCRRLIQAAVQPSSVQSKGRDHLMSEDQQYWPRLAWVSNQLAYQYTVDTNLVAQAHAVIADSGHHQLSAPMTCVPNRSAGAWLHTASLDTYKGDCIATNGLIAVATVRSRMQQYDRILELFTFAVPAASVYPTVDPLRLGGFHSTAAHCRLPPALPVSLVSPAPSNLMGYTSEADRWLPLTQTVAFWAASLDALAPLRTRQSFVFPDKTLLQYDCGKLQKLALLLRELKAGHHRSLIFSQMTRVLDILEQFLNLHGYRYLRLDGATPVAQRWELTERFNRNARIDVFISSTRAGGLGINLTGADTVIFYDTDWNPFMDMQCQDRAHRIGQTKDVHIYRLISSATIEENILQKASEKRVLDQLVLQQGQFHTDALRKVDWKEVARDVLDQTLQSTASASQANGESLQTVNRSDSPGQASPTGSLDGWSQADFEQGLVQAEDAQDVNALSAAKTEMAQMDWGDFGALAALPCSSPPPAATDSPIASTRLQSAQLHELGEAGESMVENPDVGHVDDYIFETLERQIAAV